jgi:transcriptional regulator with XRE-family HTH domain
MNQPVVEPTHWGNLIRERMKALGITQWTELAGLLGVDRSSIRRMANCPKPPKILRIRKKVEDFLSGKIVPSRPTLVSSSVVVPGARSASSRTPQIVVQVAAEGIVKANCLLRELFYQTPEIRRELRQVLGDDFHRFLVLARALSSEELHARVSEDGELNPQPRSGGRHG